jgi:alpha-ketoglutarate-dependent taurine dioxygenase
MAYQFGTSAKPENVGEYIAEQFDSGALYVHLQGVPFSHLESGAQEAYIREASSFLGELSLSSTEATSDVWRLDSSSSPSSSRIPYHTDNPFYEKPEKYVGFWNVNSSVIGGENVLLPLRTILEATNTAPKTAEVLAEARARQVVFLQGDNQAASRIIDTNNQTVRFDARYIDAPNAGLAHRMTMILEGQTFKPEIIKLAKGDVLFFDNRKLLHSREPYSDKSRINIRVRIKDEEA